MTGYTHLYYGNGKGKTTAAMGLALRAYGNGWPVLILQFLKNTRSGEITALEKLSGISVLRGKAGDGLSFSMTETEKLQTMRIHTDNFNEAMRRAKQGKCKLLILDEICAALEYRLIDEKAVKDFVLHKCHGLELVLTGKNPPEWMFAASDYISEMVLHKHPFSSGVCARSGIEY